MRTLASSRARRRMKSTTAGSSTGGLVSGRMTRLVTPPAAAAALALAIVSRCSAPGLADEGAHVDESRSDHVAFAVDDARLVRELIARHRGADARDHPVHRQEPSARLRCAFRIDEAGVEKGDRRG